MDPLRLEKARAKYHRLYRRKIQWFRVIYLFTNQECTDCARTDCACKDSICSHVQTEARKLGHEFASTGHRLRFIGGQGCIVPPHLRETCTLYLCQAAMAKPDFDRQKFDRLKAIAGRIEWSLMVLEDEFGRQLRGG